ncbi:MAG: hypothetical protein JXA52_10415, partial [Planctomycetes bacterium]|nr:hypothetical protein [Planctomycetota bacterium]
WSVFLGPSRAVVEAGISPYVAVSYPIPGYATTLPIPVAGIMDWIFFAFFVSMVVRFKLPRWKLLPATALGIIAGVLFTKLTQSAFPLLASLAPAFGIFYFFEIMPSKRELLITLIFIVVMLAIFAAIGFLQGRFKAVPEGQGLPTRPDTIRPPVLAAAVPQPPQSPSLRP